MSSRLILPGDPRWPNRQIKPPYGAVEIDWAHSLARGLVAYVLLNEGTGNRITNLASAIQPVVTAGTLSSVDGVWGRGIEAIGTFATAATIGLASSDTVSISGRLRQLTNGSTYEAIATVSGARGFFLNQNHLFYYSPTPSSRDTFTLTQYQPCNIGVTVTAGAGIQYYVNGLATGTTAINAGSVMPVAVFSDGTASECWKSHCSYLAIWNRIISASEMGAMHADPYCFLRPVVRRNYGFVGGGAPPAEASGYMRLGKYWW